jgi:flagellar protein FlaJ
MKNIKYTNFSLKTFKGLILKYNKTPLEQRNIKLVRANISHSYEEYYSKAIMSSILGFIISFFIIFILYSLISSNIGIFLLILIPLSISLSIAGFFIYYPTYLEGLRGRNIDLFLPYAINFISSMAVAGISPSEIFETLSKVKVYGEVQVEAKKITKEIKVMGTDNITALKHAIEISPSKKFKSFLQGIIGTIQSGSDLHSHLLNVASKYMEEDLTDRKRDLDLLAVIAEVLVLSVIAFPILLVIILTVMGFFGGSMSLSLNLLLLFSFIILPVIYILFYTLIRSTSIEQITKVKPEKKLTISSFYRENKISILLLLVSICSIILLYVFINLFAFLGYLDLNIYTIWDFSFISLLILMLPIGIYNYLKMKIKKEKQHRLPEFLTEVGDSLATGMNIFESIKSANKSHYGRLDPDIKKMKTQLSWNVSMKNVLFDFADRLKTAIAYRIVIAIDKGLLMGGNTPKIFKAAAKEVDQVNQIEHQRKAIMSIYALVILVCFFVFIGIIYILNGTIFGSFLAIQSEQSVNFGSTLQLSRVDPMMLEYTLYSFVFVQSLGAGVLSGFMMDGKLSSGVRISCILGIISIIVFKIMM